MTLSDGESSLAVGGGCVVISKSVLSEVGAVTFSVLSEVGAITSFVSQFDAAACKRGKENVIGVDQQLQTSSECFSTRH